MSATACSERVKVIFETDMQTDCDDAATLAMLHAYADQGKIEILGVMSNSASPDSVGAIDAINTYFGHPDLLIGAYKGDEVGEQDAPIYKNINEDIAHFPHDIIHRDQVPDAVELYHELLSQHDDVVIVSVGHLQTIATLLKSEGGMELVSQNVRQMIVTGGSVLKRSNEYNLTRHGGAPSAVYVLENFPSQILFSPWDVGTTVLTGQALMDNSDASPVKRAYDVHSRVHTNGQWLDGPYLPHTDVGPPLEDGRPSWDQTAALVAGLGSDGLFSVVSEGYMFVDGEEGGVTQWQTDENNPNHPNHAYLVKNVSDAALSKLISSAMDYEPKQKQR